MTKRSSVPTRENPVFAGKSGDGGNRTHAIVHPSDVVRNCSLVQPTSRTHTRVLLPLVSTPGGWYEDVWLDVRGRRRSACTKPGYRKGVAPASKGKKYDDYEVPTDAEIRALMDAAVAPSPSAHRLIGPRNRALIAFLRGTGLRISEALDFRPDDLNAEKGMVLVRCGKGSKRARCGIAPFALEEVQAWMEIRGEAGFTDAQPLFPVVEGSTRGGRMNSPYVRTVLKTLAERAGVDKRVNPHCFRHALALDMARRNIPLPIISRQLRHSNVATTATYLRKLSDDEVYDAVAALEWAA